MKPFHDSRILICLNENFGKRVAKMFAAELDMHYIDCKELIELDLLNRKVGKDESNLNFLVRQEQEGLKPCATAENSIIYLTFNLYKRNKDIFKKIKLYYLKLPLGLLADYDKLNRIGYAYRDEFLMQISYKVISLETLDVNEVVKILKTGEEK